MALINCTECGKQISDKAEFCPHCGCPKTVFLETLGSQNLSEPTEVNQAFETQELNESIKPIEPEPVRCPVCSSTQITGKKKGFGLGKAVIGGLILGPFGLLGGAIGSNKTMVVCLNCGHEWNLETHN